MSKDNKVKEMRLLLSDQESRDEFYEQHRLLILNIANRVARLTGGKENIGDLVQTGWCALLTAKERYCNRRRGQTRFSTYAYDWILGIMKHSGRHKEEFYLDAAVNHHTDDSGEQVSFLDLVPAQGPGPDKNLEYKELWKVVDTLPPKLRRVILGRFRDEMTLAEVGEELSLTRARVQQLEVEGLAILKKRLTGSTFPARRKPVLSIRAVQ